MSQFDLTLIKKQPISEHAFNCALDALIRCFFKDLMLLSRLLYITERKYWNQLKKFRKFRDVLSSGSHETGGTSKKVTASDSAKPHIYIWYGDFYIWGIDAIKFLWRLGEGVGG